MNINTLNPVGYFSCRSCACISIVFIQLHSYACVHNYKGYSKGTEMSNYTAKVLALQGCATLYMVTLSS